MDGTTGGKNGRTADRSGRPAAEMGEPPPESVSYRRRSESRREKCESRHRRGDDVRPGTRGSRRKSRCCRSERVSRQALSCRCRGESVVRRGNAVPAAVDALALVLEVPTAGCDGMPANQVGCQLLMTRLRSCRSLSPHGPTLLPPLPSYRLPPGYGKSGEGVCWRAMRPALVSSVTAAGVLVV